MDHDKLALISPALLDRMLNHLSGGQRLKEPTNPLIPDTNINQTLLSKNIENMSSAMATKPSQLKKYEASLKRFRDNVEKSNVIDAGSNVNEEVENTKENNETNSRDFSQNFSNNYKKSVSESSELIYDDENDNTDIEDGDEQFMDSTETVRSEVSPTKSIVSDYSGSPLKVNTSLDRYKAKKSIEEGLTKDQRFAVGQIRTIIQQSAGLINVAPNGTVEINNKKIQDSHAKDLFTAIVSNKKSKPLPNGILEFASALIKSGLPKTVIKDDRIKKSLKSSTSFPIATDDKKGSYVSEWLEEK